MPTAPPAKPPATQPPKLVAVRLLKAGAVDDRRYQIGDVVELEAHVAALLVQTRKAELLPSTPASVPATGAT